MTTRTPGRLRPVDFVHGLQRTFGLRAAWPRAGRRVVLATAVIDILATGVAAAAWQVHDRETHQQVQEVRSRIGGGGSSTVVGELQQANVRLRIDHMPPDGTPELVAAPDGTGTLDPASPTGAQAGIGRLCPSGVSSSLGQQQQLLCRELVQTELAQYAFSMRMFERAAEHHARLAAIGQRRRSLGADDYADLQSNTNELLALTAAMDNDRDRYQTYMRAYEARIAHIRHAQVALTRNAFKGRGRVDVPTSL